MKLRHVSFTLLLLAGAGLTLFSAGCKSQLAQIGSQIAVSSGVVSEDQAGSITRSADALRRGFHDLTEAEEHTIGRAVAASILSRYSLLDDPTLTAYVNRVGRAVSLSSSRPEIYGGYHFAVLDSPEINAFAAPGGYILVTAGMLRLVGDEEGLAAVLAHEVAHCSQRHGLAAIKKGRLLEAFGVLQQETGVGTESLNKLTSLFDGAVSDVVSSLVESGYSRDQEREADRLAVEFATAVGYDAAGLQRVLDAMDAATKGSAKLGMLRTHPSAADRLKDIKKVVKGHGSASNAGARRDRFKRDAAKHLGA